MANISSNYHEEKDSNQEFIFIYLKESEKYIFHFDIKDKTEVLRMLGRYAAKDELPFNCNDAAIMAQKIRDTTYQYRDSTQGTLIHLVEQDSSLSKVFFSSELRRFSID